MDRWMYGWMVDWMDRKPKKPYRTKKPGNLLTQSLSKILSLILLSGDLYNDFRLRITRSLSYGLIFEGLSITWGKR